jgi:hypothetical protein
MGYYRKFLEPFVDHAEPAEVFISGVFAVLNETAEVWVVK